MSIWLNFGQRGLSQGGDCSWISAIILLLLLGHLFYCWKWLDGGVLWTWWGNYHRMGIALEFRQSFCSQAFPPLASPHNDIQRLWWRLRNNNKSPLLLSLTASHGIFGGFSFVYSCFGFIAASGQMVVVVVVVVVRVGDSCRDLWLDWRKQH